MIRLFDPPDTNDLAPARHGDRSFPYLERSARPEFAEVRAQLEKWVSSFPIEGREGLITRIRSRDDQHFSAAFFELYLHVLFCALGYDAEVHPRVGNRGRRPDFMMRNRSGGSFFLEAAVVCETNDSERGAASRISAIVDALNEIQCPDYFLHLEHRGTPATAPSLRRLRESVQKFIASLNYDEVRDKISKHGYDGAPKGAFTHDKYTLAFSAHPVRPDRRGYDGHRPVGMEGPGEAYWVDDSTPLRDKVKLKAGRYGTLEKGLVIAINMLGRHVDTTDIMNALFGEKTFMFPIDEFETADPIVRRKCNGALVGPKGPINRGVSAVLVVSSLLPWSATAVAPEVFHNPYARFPALSFADRLCNYRPTGDKLLPNEGEPIHSILGLHATWPNYSRQT